MHSSSDSFFIPGMPDSTLSYFYQEETWKNSTWSPQYKQTFTYNADKLTEITTYYRVGDGKTLDAQEKKVNYFGSLSAIEEISGRQWEMDTTRKVIVQGKMYIQQAERMYSPMGTRIR